MDNYDKIKNLTVDEIVAALSSFIVNNNIKQKLYEAIFSKASIDYESLNKLIPYLDADDLNAILKYDLDYSISFLLSVKDIAYEDDLTKQTIFLYHRHNLNYIIPLLEYVDEDTIREEMRKKWAFKKLILSCNLKYNQLRLQSLFYLGVTHHRYIILYFRL
mgnify:CR=1 FL=1